MAFSFSTSDTVRCRFATLGEIDRDFNFCCGAGDDGGQFCFARPDRDAIDEHRPRQFQMIQIGILMPIANAESRGTMIGRRFQQFDDRGLDHFLELR